MIVAGGETADSHQTFLVGFAVRLGRFIIAGLVGLLGFATTAATEGGGRVTYRQSPAVLAHFPDIPVALRTPAFEAGSQAVTSQAQLEAFVSELAARPGAPLVAKTLALSTEGRRIPILYFSAERHADPFAIQRAGRPIVWLIGQQHGNEPAASEALLAVAKSLAEGELQSLLDRLSVVIVPRANPDGAASDQRDTSLAVDMNRDHVSLRLPETRALHAALQQLPADLVIDAHEFTVASYWLEKFGGVHAADLMLLSATHPMVPSSIRRFADEQLRPAIERVTARYGITTLDYHTTSNYPGDRTVTLGGNAAGIGRNAFGLAGAVSLLIESRGVGVGRDAYQRRVATQYLAIKAALEAVAANGDQVKQAVALARTEIAANRKLLIVHYKPALVRMKLPLLDPLSGAKRTQEVDMLDSRSGTVTLERAKAAGYVLLPQAAGLAANLKLLGAMTCRIETPVELPVETFDIHERGAADSRAIHLKPNVKASLTSRRLSIPAGAIYVPLDGPSALRVATALEPDLPGSLYGLDLVPSDNSLPFAPILRVPVRAPLKPSDGALWCITGAE